MLIIIGCVLFILWGIFLLRSFDYDTMGIMFILLFSIILFFAIIIWGVAYMDNSDLTYKYNQNNLYVNSLSNNKHILNEEREKAIKIILETNYNILKTKRWRNNFIIGIYYSYDIGDLELLDINKIPNANKKMYLDINNK